MAEGSKTMLVNCAGGLNLTATTAELFQNPGFAKKLINFESSHIGGYRRINGYSKDVGHTQPSGTANPILGVFPYADGLIAVQYNGSNYNIYFSTDRITWDEVNITMAYTTGLDLTALRAGTPTTRGAEGRMQFVLYDGASDYGELVLADGNNDLAVFKITGTGAARTFHYIEIPSVGNAAWCEVYKDRVIVANTINNQNRVYWSNVNDPTDFSGALSGFIDMPSKISGLKAWRDRIFAFGERNIDEIGGLVSGAAGSAAVENISKNIGCICGCSIQEVGGDVVFLASDGLRLLSGTDRIDDISLGTISRNIDPIVKGLTSSVSAFIRNSIVIREKNQYRLFYTKSVLTDLDQKGLIGTIKQSEQGLRWEWSEIQGFPISSAYSGVIMGREVLYQGGFDGYIYDHDIGNDFNGTGIPARYETSEFDYGNLGRRDTLHWMKTSFRIEGSVSDVYLKTTFNFSNTNVTHNPVDILVLTTSGLSTYGSATFGTSIYSGVLNIENKIPLIGAGWSNKFLFYSTGSQAPYSIDNYLIKYHEGAVH